MIILVTGANRGIGKEICRQLHNGGHSVVLTAREEERGKEASKEIGCDFCVLDVTDSDSINLCASYVEKKFGKLDVLINNAGILIDSADIMHADRQIFLDTFAVNVFGPLRIVQRFRDLLRESSDARIINISSGMGQLSDMGGEWPAYSMSKVMLNVLTLKFASAMPHVKVNSVCPGWVKTDMGGSSATRSVEKGAQTAVWLVTANVGSGGFYRDMKIISW